MLPITKIRSIKGVASGREIVIDMPKEPNRARNFSILMAGHEVDDGVRQQPLGLDQDWVPALGDLDAVASQHACASRVERR